MMTFPSQERADVSPIWVLKIEIIHVKMPRPFKVKTLIQDIGDVLCKVHS